MTGKRELRIEARARRASLAAALPDFAGRITSHAGALCIPAGTPVGGYIALPGEADPGLLLARLKDMGCVIGFPRVAARNQALSFHGIPAGRAMTKSAFGVLEPSPDWPALHPEMLLVPLLAFDAQGGRLGYGGGYYDRTLAALEKSGGARAIGIAYAGQEMALLPHGEHDHPLDMIVTEQGIRHFR